jgi:excisionase family DNA binding protein
MKPTNELKLLTEKQMAEALSVSTRTTRRLRKQRILPFYQIGKGLVRYDKRQCVEALEHFKVKSSGEAEQKQEREAKGGRPTAGGN